MSKGYANTETRFVQLTHENNVDGISRRRDANTWVYCEKRLYEYYWDKYISDGVPYAVSIVVNRVFLIQCNFYFPVASINLPHWSRGQHV